MRNSRFARFLPYYKKYLPILIFDLVCAALTTVCELTLPMIIRYLTNLGMESAASLTVENVLKIGAFYLFLRLVDVFANYYMASTGHIMGARIETDMRRDFFSHLQDLSFAFYDDAKIGQLMARITSDLFDVTEFSHHCPEEFFIAAIKITGSFIILCGINVPLTLIIFAILPVMLFATSYFRKKMRSGFRQSRRQVGEINAAVEDSLLGIRVVKAFAGEPTEREKFDKGNNRFLEIKKVVYKYMALFQSSIRFFDGVMYLAVMVFGSLFIVWGKIGVADLVAYLMFVSTLLGSIRRIVEFAEQFQRGMTGIERFFEIMEVPADIAEKPGALALSAPKGEIEFIDVSFRYGENGCGVLKNFSLKISPGENVALVGPSGGGKTTLCSLIPRFYDVAGGEIRIDGIDVRDYTLKSLRDNIGIVQQDVYLFSASIFENIAYGKKGATCEEVERAAVLAGAHDFIINLEDGYDTFVGERGVKLSGGQKQRVSIARVFLKDPKILILDEATSALDSENERIVQQSLERLSKNRTTLTIAHRLTTIKNADRIVVLTADGIQEEGSHGQLLQKGGIYSVLYSSYK